MTRKAELQMDDLEVMTIGMCFDYVREYIEWNKSDNERKSRNANQQDFDAF